MSCCWIECIGCYEPYYSGGFLTCSDACATIVKTHRALNAAFASLRDALEWTDVVARESGLTRRDHIFALARRFYQRAPYLFSHGVGRTDFEEEK